MSINVLVQMEKLAVIESVHKHHWRAAVHDAGQRLGRGGTVWTCSGPKGDLLDEAFPGPHGVCEAADHPGSIPRNTAWSGRVLLRKSGRLRFLK